MMAGLLLSLSACMRTEAPEPAPEEGAEAVEIARLSDVDIPEDAPTTAMLEGEPASPQGLFAGLFGGGTAAADADPETPATRRLEEFGVAAEATEGAAPIGPLAFGEMRKVCGVRGKALGKEVDRFPETGRGFRLYDSAPGSTAPRLHSVTGFKDGCARQFTAGLAMLGAPLTHETLRYDPLVKSIPYSQTDTAYEQIKRSVCGKGRGKPCEGNGAKRMEKTTAFITVYERFGGASHTEILIHDGKVVAQDYERR
ncbi:hypothetical protein PSA7680_02295 [Pseudoruegeria aquimaris]|uniref:Uncharacterized protein n=1 Tax=Pseudoruegeria aquimaris TaxID=393663 RepID=A0A1Y5SP46_9RHOB|nr:hypothetical protein [Pseudoruegeria aquimaris]SLN45115.1 hypothetical protein PSA7680_02295 [Pseudoruegeria aquimaris]